MTRTALSVPRILLALLCFLPGAALAQGAAAAGVELRLLAFHRQAEQEEAFVHDAADGPEVPGLPVAIRGALNHEFARIQTRSRRLIFTTAAAAASRQQPDMRIGEVMLPPRLRSGILVFLPAGGPEGAGDPARVLVVEDSAAAFPAGSYHVANLSPQVVRLVLEKTIYEYAPGDSKGITKPPVRENGMTGMRAFVKEQDGGWRAVSTSLWQHPGRARSLKLLFQDPRSGRIQLRSFDDVPPRPADAEPAG